MVRASPWLSGGALFRCNPCCSYRRYHCISACALFKVLSCFAPRYLNSLWFAATYTDRPLSHHPCGIASALPRRFLCVAVDVPSASRCFGRCGKARPRVAWPCFITVCWCFESYANHSCVSPGVWVQVYQQGISPNVAIVGPARLSQKVMSRDCMPTQGGGYCTLHS